MFASSNVANTACVTPLSPIIHDLMPCEAKPALAGPPMKVNLDWTRNPRPQNLTPFQRTIRDVDWAKTGLGPMDCWGRDLRQTVLMMMAELNPVIVYWGERCTMIYNEAYIPLVGSQHPANLGADAPNEFPQFWSFFDAIISEQRYTGETRVGEASMLMMERQGFLEETYFDWNLIPIIGDDGTMVGTYGRPSEATMEIIGSRRQETVHKLAHSIDRVKSLPALWKVAVNSLSMNDKDVPLAMLYSLEPQLSATGLPTIWGPTCKLEETLGVPSDHRDVRQSLDLNHDTAGFGPAMYQAWQTGEIVQISAGHANLAQFFCENSWRGFGVPCAQYLVVPVKANDVVSALMVLGLNPRRRYNESYKTFVDMIAGVLSAQFSKLWLAEEVDHRNEAARRSAVNFQASELKFSRFAERSPVGLALCDTNGKVFYANDAWYNFCGLVPGDVEYPNWIEMVADEDVPLIQEWWRKMFVEKQGGTFQIRSKQPFERGHMKSQYRTAICASYADLDEHGNVATIMGLVMDISEQKWIEEQLILQKRALEQSEEQYRTFAERSPHGVVRTDGEGYVQFGNRAWHDFYGFQPGSVTRPQPWIDELDPQDQVAAREYFEMVRRSKDPVPIEIRKARHGHGEEQMWLLAVGWAEFRPDGSIDYLMFWVTDITAQKAASEILTTKMEEAIRLKTQQERFMDLISHEIRNPLSAVLHCGEEIVDSMKRCLTALSTLPDPGILSLKEKSAQNLTRIQINGALEAANTIMYCVQHQKQIVDDVLTLSKLDSDLLEVSPVPVQPTQLVQSALKIFEPELKASKIDLTIEHDRSLADLDLDWILLDPHRYLQIVINLVTNAIKFTRPSSLRRIVVTLAARDRPPKQHHLGIEYVPKRRNTLSAQPAQVDSGSSPKAPLFLCLSVADTGKGLDETEKARLFHRFAQGSPKTHTEYGGSGLGLFISRQITEMLGGGIGVGTPSKDGGCTFAFYVQTTRTKPPRRSSMGIEVDQVYTSALLNPPQSEFFSTEQVEKRRHQQHPHQTQPLQPAQTTAAPAAPTAVVKTTPRRITSPEPIASKCRVLVVEDNLINQKVLCKQLRTRGFVVDSANHGREALAALHKKDTEENGINSTGLPQAGNFDVILCDIEMPVMNGIECVTEIRRQESIGELPGHIPIIGVTANVRSTQVNTAIEVGMDGVTTKPYRIDELIAHIERVRLDLQHANLGKV